MSCLLLPHSKLYLSTCHLQGLQAYIEISFFFFFFILVTGALMIYCAERGAVKLGVEEQSLF